MKYAIMLCLALLGCRPMAEEVTPLAGAPNPSVQNYVQQFESASGRTVHIPVMLVPRSTLAVMGQSGDTVGLCVGTDVPGGISVLLPEDFWPHASDTERWVLIFHELGHCILGRGHSNTTLMDDCPISVMWPAIDRPVKCLDTGLHSRQAYIDELIHGGQDDEPAE